MKCTFLSTYFRYFKKIILLIGFGANFHLI